MDVEEKRLIIKLDQYAGNVDEIVCTSLLGVGEDRYGYKQACTVYKNRVEPLLADDWFPIDLHSLSTEYGHVLYTLDSDCNNLQIGIGCFTDDEAIKEAICLWRQAYPSKEKGVELHIEVPDIHGQAVVVIKVLGFQILTYTPHRRDINVE